MFIRSKYEKLGGKHDDAINPPTSLKNIQVIVTQASEDDWSIRFGYFHSAGAIFWDYKTKEQRDSEYEWILSQMDCLVNEGNGIKAPVPVTDYEKLGFVKGAFVSQEVSVTGRLDIMKITYVSENGGLDVISEDGIQYGWSADLSKIYDGDWSGLRQKQE